MSTEISTGKEYIETQVEGAGLVTPSVCSETLIKAGYSSEKYIEVAISAQEEL